MDGGAGIIQKSGCVKHTMPFLGHRNVRANHRTTIEITTEASLSVRGDCIIGVGSPAGCAGLPARIREGLRNDASRARVRIMVGDASFVVWGRGSSGLTLAHQTDIVLRKSKFLCPRTLMIRCDAASSDMPRHIVRRLQEGAGGTMEITVYPPQQSGGL